MPELEIYANNVQEAVHWIVTKYPEDTSDPAHKDIYFEGWDGLAASAVLKAIAQDPSADGREKFDKIIHLDCSRWKNRRALQRAIAEELRLSPWIMAIFDRQDKDDDFRGVDEAYRKEIRDIAIEIRRTLQGHKCLLVFHNGSNHTIDFTDFGIPPRDQLLDIGTTLLWTFRGRLRLNPQIKENVDNSHLCLYATYSLHGFKVRTTARVADHARQEEARELALRREAGELALPGEAEKLALLQMGRQVQEKPNGMASTQGMPSVFALWQQAARELALQEEARELAGYTQHKQGINPELARECCLYLLSLNSKGGDTMDYNWATHASTYWVCDGIIQGGESDEAWEAAAALHHQMRIEDYSSNNTLPPFGDELLTPPNRWVFINTKKTKTNKPTVPPESSSFFLASKGGSDHPIASLPNDMFRHSDKLRVLKLCRCTFSFSSPPFRCCRSLRFLGLDACKDQPQKEEEEKQDRPAMEFFQSLWVLDICYTDWELDLSPEIIEQMAANIREVHIKKGRIWRSDLAWRRLQNLRKLRVIEPTCPWETGDMDEFTDMMKLELLDLSGNITMQVLPGLSGATSLKTIVLDGCTALEHVGPEGFLPSLESFSLDASAGEDHNKEAKTSRISLAGCARLLDFTLRGPLPNLEELDLSGTPVKMLDLSKSKCLSLQRMILMGCLQLHAILWPEERLPKLTVLCIDSLVCRVQKEHHQAYAAIMDMRFVQSLVLKSPLKFCCNNDRFHLKLGVSKIGPPLQKSLIHNTGFIYTDVTIDKKTTGHDDSSAPQFEPLGWHVEIGEGVNYTNVASPQGIGAINFVMDEAESLHVHDNSSITSAIPERTMMSTKQEECPKLKRCRVEKCPKLHTVFPTNYDTWCIQELETFSAVDLLMAHCIWSKGRANDFFSHLSFAKLRSIHLYSCPRLTFVLPLSWNANYSRLPNLETLHIVYCGDLRQVFPVEARFLKDTLEFPKLKHIYLHELPSLQQICEVKLFATMLKTIRIRGCWGLRRLPAVSLRRRSLSYRPVVDCEKDWWEKLEWDEDVDHHRSLFNPRHSQYYKKPVPKGFILR